MAGGDVEHFFVYMLLPMGTQWILKNDKYPWSKRKRFLFSFLFLAAVVCVTESMYIAKQPPNYYQFLDVSVNSSPADIKKAYRQKSLELHPDKNPNDPLANDKMAYLTKIYEVLTDSAKKNMYDRQGEAALNRKPSEGSVESEVIISMATFYVVWSVLTFLLTMGKESSKGRNIAFTGLVLLLILECNMTFGSYDFAVFLFSKTTIFEKVGALHRFYPAILNCARVYSVHTFFDFEQQTHEMLRDVLDSTRETLNTVKQIQLTLDKKWSKVKSIDGGPTAAGFDDAGSADDSSSNLPSNLRQKLHTSETTKERRKRGEGENRKGGIPGWVVMIGVYVFFNYVLK